MIHFDADVDSRDYPVTRITGLDSIGASYGNLLVTRGLALLGQWSGNGTPGTFSLDAGSDGDRLTLLVPTAIAGASFVISASGVGFSQITIDGSVAGSLIELISYGGWYVKSFRGGVTLS